MSKIFKIYGEGEKMIGCGRKFDSDLKYCGEEIEEGTELVWLCPECAEIKSKTHKESEE